MAKIKAVTFDVGGTLIRPSPSVGEIYARIAGLHGAAGISPAVLDQRFSSIWGGLQDFNYTREDWAGIVKQVFKGLTTVSTETFFDDLYAHFARAEAWHLYDDVLPALNKLASAGARLGIISNWDERLRPLLNRLQIDRYFEVIVVSLDIGFHKPSPVIFEYAAQKLGLPRDAILHVGDSRELDVNGARRAGLHAVELCRGERHAAKAEEIGSLMEMEFADF